MSSRTGNKEESVTTTATNTTHDSSTTSPEFYKLRIGRLPDELYHDHIPVEQWLALAESTHDPNGFPTNSLNQLGPVDPMVEWERIIGITLWMASNVFPFATIVLGSLAWMLQSSILWYILLSFWAYVGILATVEEYYFKPIFLKRYHRTETFSMDNIKDNQYLFTERNTSKYLDTTLVWPKSLHLDTTTKKDHAKTYIFCLVPHGVAPVGATAYPIWSKLWSSRLCHWTCAPVVLQIPMVGYFMKAIGYIPAKSKQILDTLQKKEESVGVFLDGIAGMFHSQSQGEERAVLKQRKGICKIALRAGVPIVPVYAFGHSLTYSVLVDPFGILESISIQLQTALVPFFGRYGWFLGPPRRVPVTLCLGDPIVTSPMPIAEPTKAEIDKCHERMVQGFVQVFEKHKPAYGWGNKSLKIV